MPTSVNSIGGIFAVIALILAIVLTVVGQLAYSIAAIVILLALARLF